MLLLALSHALTIPTTLRAHRGNNRIERVRAYWRKDDASPLARRLDKIIAAAPAPVSDDDAEWQDASARSRRQWYDG